MFYKIQRIGKTDSYPYEDSVHFISKDGENWEQLLYPDCDRIEFPKELIHEAFSYKLKKYEVKSFVMEVKQ